MTTFLATSQAPEPEVPEPEDPVFPSCQYCAEPGDYRCDFVLGPSAVAFCRLPLCQSHAAITEPQPGHVQVRCPQHRDG